MQIFWNVLAIELVTICITWSEGGDDDPEYLLLTVLITGGFTGICVFLMTVISRRIFRWGNRRKVQTWVIVKLYRKVRACCRRRRGAPARNGAAGKRTRAAAQRVKRHGVRVYRLRSFVAWTIIIALCIVSHMLSVIYGVMFGKVQTRMMFESWGVALINMWLIAEPIQIVLLALLPFIMDSSKVEWLRAAYNNVFAV